MIKDKTDVGSIEAEVRVFCELGLRLSPKNIAANFSRKTAGNGPKQVGDFPAKAVNATWK